MDERTPKPKIEKLKPAIKYTDKDGVEHIRTGQNHSDIEKSLRGEFPDARRDADGWLIDIIDGSAVEGTNIFFDRTQTGRLMKVDGPVTSEELRKYQSNNKN